MKNRLSDNQIPSLEHAVVSAAMDAGIAAMRYYRSVFLTAGPTSSGANPSTEADIAATEAATRSLSATMPLIDPGYVVLAEEGPSHSRTAEPSWIPQTTCVVLDGLDGTANFRAEIPLFCSAVAVLDRGRPIAGAIYDPIRHEVLFGSLPRSSPSRVRKWNIASGTSSPLQAPRTETPDTVAIHLTRTNPELRKQATALLKSEALQQRTVYQLNCGQLQLSYVATSQLSAFVNNHTNSWDVAAGEVLVSAAGGVVTTLKGVPIDYTRPGRTSVVAARQPESHASLLAGLASKPVAKA